MPLAQAIHAISLARLHGTGGDLAKNLHGPDGLELCKFNAVLAVIACVLAGEFSVGRSFS